MKMQELLLKFRSDAPTDFLIFPATFSVFEEELSYHLYSKRNNRFFD